MSLNKYYLNKYVQSLMLANCIIFNFIITMQKQQQIRGLFSQPQQNSDHIEYLKSELSVFLNLLMNQQKQNGLVQNKNNQKYEKLSIVLSASEQEYTSAENQRKQCTNQQIEINQSDKYQSQNFYKRYFESDSSESNEFIQAIIHKSIQQIDLNSKPSNLINLDAKKNILDHQKQNNHLSKEQNIQKFFDYCQSNLPRQQFYLLQKLKATMKHYEDQIKYLLMTKQKNEMILSITKKKYEELIQFLRNKNKQEKQLRKLLKQSQKKIENVETSNKQIIEQNVYVKHELEIFKNQNLYLKELILLANKNYQNLQNKYAVLQKINMNNTLQKHNQTTPEDKSTRKNSIISIVRTQSNRQKVNQKANIKQSKRKSSKNRQSTSQKYRNYFMKMLKSNKDQRLC